MSSENTSPLLSANRAPTLLDRPVNNSWESIQAGACTFSIVSDQAQTVPVGKAMLVHSRCFVTDPSGEDYRRRTVSEICGGYKAVKFRFLLFL